MDQTGDQKLQSVDFNSGLGGLNKRLFAGGVHIYKAHFRLHAGFGAFSLQIKVSSAVSCAFDLNGTNSTSHSSAPRHLVLAIRCGRDTMEKP